MPRKRDLVYCSVLPIQYYTIGDPNGILKHNSHIYTGKKSEIHTTKFEIAPLNP
jgi:hypothetical protein